MVIRQRRCKNPECNSRYYTREEDIPLNVGRKLFSEITEENERRLKL